MERVGERLRRERESRETSIEALSAASGIGQSYLEALERGEIDALPGPAFGKLYIRAYAEVLGFDPQPWIDDYDRERRRLQGGVSEAAAPRPSAESRPVAAAIARWKEARGADKQEPVAEVRSAPEPQPELMPEPAPEPTPEPTPKPEVARSPVRRPKRNRQFVPAIVAFVLVAIASWMCLARRPRVEPSPVAPAPLSQPPAPRPTEPARTEPPRITPVEPKAMTAKPAPPPKRESAPGALTVTESGTGRRVVDSRLEGEAEEFAEGEAVVFQTRVIGGSRGEAVRHVWIYEGRAQQSITLRLGGPDWRTFSKKTLYRRGRWTVEARDQAGRVLARAAFTCVPASR